MRDRLIELLKQGDKTFADKYTGKVMLNIDKLYEFISDYLLENGVIVPPCKVGDWMWYVYQNEINKAKVEEISYDASKHGYYSYSFTAYAYDFKNKRQVTYHPINETQKNKSNINEVEGMSFGEEVFIFLTKEEAEAALKERERG